VVDLRAIPEGAPWFAQNANGEKRVIAAFKKLQDANDKAVAVESDFKSLGAAAWCERDEVPLSFVFRVSQAAPLPPTIGDLYCPWPGVTVAWPSIFSRALVT
jgi:hypothetical protein